MPASKVLVTGGCGYIGSHIVRQLGEHGYEPIIIDDLSTGFKDALTKKEQLYVADVADKDALRTVFSSHDFAGVIHLAASVVVPESVSDPLKYYDNNTTATLRLLKACVDHKVPNLIFSSTAAVYGESQVSPVKELDPSIPTNPYGYSKLIDERIIQDVHQAHGMNYIILRYFNVAGADPDLRMGQRTPKATHLVKVACEAAIGKRKLLEVFGDDYNTVDGTGVRDYIHVEDLAAAHISALKHVMNKGNVGIFNCGYGKGYSVKEVIQTLEKVCGQSLPTRHSTRRPGDVGELVANCEKIRSTLDWTPQYDRLETIVSTALSWEKKLQTIQN